MQEENFGGKFKEDNFWGPMPLRIFGETTSMDHPRALKKENFGEEISMIATEDLAVAIRGQNSGIGTGGGELIRVPDDMEDDGHPLILGIPRLVNEWNLPPPSQIINVEVSLPQEILVWASQLSQQREKPTENFLFQVMQEMGEH